MAEDSAGADGTGIAGDDQEEMKDLSQIHFNEAPEQDIFTTPAVQERTLADTRKEIFFKAVTNGREEEWEVQFELERERELQMQQEWAARHEAKRREGEILDKAAALQNVKTEEKLLEELRELDEKGESMTDVMAACFQGNDHQGYIVGAQKIHAIAQRLGLTALKRACEAAESLGAQILDTPTDQSLLDERIELIILIANELDRLNGFLNNSDKQDAPGEDGRQAMEAEASDAMDT